GIRRRVIALRSGWMPSKPHKKFDKLSYGALALYVGLMGVLAIAVYGINLSSIIMDQSRSERERAQAQSGRMVVMSADRSQCRTLRFDNEPAELGRETMVDCDAARIGGGSGSFGIGFNKR